MSVRFCRKQRSIVHHRFALAACLAFCLALFTPSTVHAQSKSTDLAAIDWIHGAADCESLVSSAEYVEWQQVRIAADTYVFRQNKCSHYEGPFVYLFIGAERGLLLDTGATVAGGYVLRDLIRRISTLPITVAHTHGHSDHHLGDEAFDNAQGFTVVETGTQAVQDYFGFTNWPLDATSFALGERDIQLLPIPGHSDDDLAYYDPQTDILTTGDSLYPGRLYVRNWPQYSTSIDRLAIWASEKSPSLILGTHIEMSSTLNSDYPVGTTFQPDEHALPLQLESILLLRDALQDTTEPERIPLGSFIIWPI